MRAMLIGFALGVAGLQQRAALPGRWEWAVAGALLAGVCGFACRAWARGTAESPEASRSSATPRRSPSPSPASGAAARWLVRWRSVAAPAAAFVAAVIVGHYYAAVRAEMRMAAALPPSWELRDLALTGYVRGLPTQDASTARFLFAVDVDEAQRITGIEHFPPIVQLNWTARGGHDVPRLTPGERWRLTVRMKRPHGHANFAGHDAEAGLLARGVRATGYVRATADVERLPGMAGGIGTSIDRARLMLRDRVARALTGAAHRGIVAALAIGAQDAMTEADRLALRRTGTSHLVAVSGLHIGFVAGLVAALAAWLWRRSCGFGALLARRGAREWPLVLPTPIVAAAAGVASAAGYAALSGFNVPAQRALWMLAVASAAFVLGRGVAFSLVLAWAAALVLIVDPWAVTAAGFWLSFGAVSVIAFAMRGRLRMREDEDGAHDLIDAMRASDPAWETPSEHDPARGSARSLWPRRLAALRRRCADAIRAQWAVTIGLAPLTAFWFSQVSLAGPLANAVAVPWVSLLVVPVVLVAIVLPAPVDALAYRLAHALLEPLMHILGSLAGSPWAERHLPRPSFWALASALAGVAWCLMPRGWPLRFAAPLAWLPLVVPPAPGVEEGAFRLTALDIGQGASILVETRRRTLLFDAGPGPESTHAGERIVVPVLRAGGVARLDALVVSHGDADHAGGVPAVLESLDVRQLLGGLPPAHRLWAMAPERRADALRCAAGQRWRWDGVEFEVLWPDPGPLPRRANEQSCVLKISAAGMSALLTGDIGAPSERVLVQRAPDALRADVLLAAHHGSKTSSTESFLDSADPRFALFQVGYRNRFRHPHPHVWSRFEARDITLARTDRDGAVRVTTNDGLPVLERYRESHARYWMDR
ncbi:DNA internalization-related competence protein ComEC/Rec2 [Trinickia dinghuensis]|uniref:DNA internalization-related competence protein ComEC/Rec2 n=1 Tax=Trinickia dinghuensis TaxID=2291023 RepID=A0A3D8JZ54_9BURK|nr:DNA internalization-related competence protein ComEC/Rec2 [Trinickia dinghuensis]RDU97895.1 DNA internalization-related competence protein ComEC/Rec2 [Trinickia dinghuensis]